MFLINKKHMKHDFKIGDRLVLVKSINKWIAKDNMEIGQEYIVCGINEIYLSFENKKYWHDMEQFVHAKPNTTIQGLEIGAWYQDSSYGWTSTDYIKLTGYSTIQLVGREIIAKGNYYESAVDKRWTYKKESLRKVSLFEVLPYLPKREETKDLSQEKSFFIIQKTKTIKF